MCDGNVEVIPNSDICKQPISNYYVAEGQIGQPLTLAICEIVTERSISLIILWRTRQ